MKAWQQKFNTNIGDLSKWLKSRAEGPTPVIEKDGVTAKTRPEAIQMIKDHWQEVWNRYPDPEEKRRKIETACKTFEEEFQREGMIQTKEWERPSMEELRNKQKECDGSAGPDQWSSEEVKNIPYNALLTFAEVTKMWEREGRAPEVLREARQVNLPKPGKEVERPWGASLPAKATRPISVSRFGGAFGEAGGVRARTWRPGGRRISHRR